MAKETEVAGITKATAELLAKRADTEVKRHQLEGELAKVHAEQDKLAAQLLRSGFFDAAVLHW